MTRLLLGLALGATSAFLFDPQHGPRRRELVRDKVTKTVNEGREFADAARADLRQRAQGQGVAAFKGFAEETWTPGVRVVAGGVGALLLVYALSRGGLSTIGALAAGAAFLGRARTNRPLVGRSPRRERQAA